MKIHANGAPFSIGITFPMDIKEGTSEKSISPGQVRFCTIIIYMYEKKKKSLILGSPLKRYLRLKSDLYQNLSSIYVIMYASCVKCKVTIESSTITVSKVPYC